MMDVDEPGPMVNGTMYREIIESFLYLTISRLGNVFGREICDSFQAYRKESHLKAAKRILRYLKRPRDLVLFYPSGDNFDIIIYTDADYVGYLFDRKSTFGGFL